MVGQQQEVVVQWKMAAEPERLRAEGGWGLRVLQWVRQSPQEMEWLLSDSSCTASDGGLIYIRSERGQYNMRSEPLSRANLQKYVTFLLITL